ncbi:MAG TPA: nucleotidyltransferase domain-containing protein [Oscillatoriaceae cyanobacterium]
MEEQNNQAVSHPGLVAQIRATVRQLEPSAEIVLFGSRARRDANCDSDWDLLVILDGPVDAGRKQRIRHDLYALERAAGEVLSAIITSREEWETPRFKLSPFYLNVMQEGVQL